MFELLRKFSLLMLLFVVGLGTYLSADDSTDWREPLLVKLYPINGDGSFVTRDYINDLDPSLFSSIETFMLEEAARYGIRTSQPVRVELGYELDELPPSPGRAPNILEIMWWSLNFRWWANEVTEYDGAPEPDIRLFLVYYDPEYHPTLAHSVGLQQGMIGIVNVFAMEAQAETNNFVILHEMMHTLGATDKYDFAGNMPLFPEGYADPERTPLYPQRDAEIMGGRIPLSRTEATIPENLQQVLVGPATAEEIRWLR
jgi:hypothetical protein